LDLRVAAEQPLPRSVGQDDFLVVVRPVFFRAEEPSDYGPRAEDIEPLHGDGRALQPFRSDHRATAARVVVVAAAEDRGVLEDAAAVPRLRKIGNREGNATEVQLVIFGAQRQHALRIGNPGRMEEHLIDDAEDGGVRPDSQGQRSQRRKREPGASGERAGGKTQIG
jgi:hypothetical protein